MRCSDNDIMSESLVKRTRLLADSKFVERIALITCTLSVKCNSNDAIDILDLRRKKKLYARLQSVTLAATKHDVR